jgi:uncharacterized protein YkwD
MFRICASISGFIALAFFAVGLAQQSRAAATAPSNTAQAKNLITSLKNPKLSADDRRKIVQEIMGLGDDGPKQLAIYAAAETNSRGDAYLTRFDRALSAALQARVKANGGAAKIEAEIASLRKQSIDVSRGPNLTKDAIHDKCDPAIKRLSELLTVTVEQATEQQADLKTSREDVLEYSRIYHAAFDKVPAEKRKGIAETPATETLDKDLAAREKLALLLAMPMTKLDREVLQSNISIAAKMDAEEVAAINEVNRLRLLLGIGAVSIDPKLGVAARGHSRDMVEKKFFDHTSPIPGKETPWKRAALAGTSASAENIYEGSKKGEDAIKTWWYSPGHHANMMSVARRIGVGRQDGTFTQMFGK